jgi:hypothetical protein
MTRRDTKILVAAGVAVAAWFWWRKVRGATTLTPGAPSPSVPSNPGEQLNPQAGGNGAGAGNPTDISNTIRPVSTPAQRARAIAARQAAQAEPEDKTVKPGTLLMGEGAGTRESHRVGELKLVGIHRKTLLPRYLQWRAIKTAKWGTRGRWVAM